MVHWGWLVLAFALGIAVGVWLMILFGASEKQEKARKSWPR
jgi:cytochrome c biogenesis protein CcdA